MTCKFARFKNLQHRMRRTMHYGKRNVNCLTEPLSQMVVDYFENHEDFSSNPLDMEFLSSFSHRRCVNPCTLLVALIYVNRMNPNHTETPSSCRRHDSAEMFLSALVLATKYLNDGGLDEFVWNDEFASASNFDIAKINRLELAMLDELDWNLLVDEETFERAFYAAERWIAAESLRKNGFLTYNEINVFVTDSGQYLPYVEQFVAICLTIIATYATTIALVVCTTAAPALLLNHSTNQSNRIAPKQVSYFGLKLSTSSQFSIQPNDNLKISFSSNTPMSRRREAALPPFSLPSIGREAELSNLDLTFQNLDPTTKTTTTAARSNSPQRFNESFAELKAWGLIQWTHACLSTQLALPTFKRAGALSTSIVF